MKTVPFFRGKMYGALLYCTLSVYFFMYPLLPLPQRQHTGRQGRG